VFTLHQPVITFSPLPFRRDFLNQSLKHFYLNINAYSKLSSLEQLCVTCNHSPYKGTMYIRKLSGAKQPL